MTHVNGSREKEPVAMRYSYRPLLLKKNTPLLANLIGTLLGNVVTEF